MESGKRGERGGDRGQGREERGKGIITCGWIYTKLTPNILTSTLRPCADECKHGPNKD